MATYDPGILQKFADSLYSRANGIIVTYTLVGLIVGAVGGFFLETVLRTGNVLVVVGVVAVMVGGIGSSIGSAKAFILKFQAQVALCQRQIEMNTRPRAVLTVPPLP